MGKGSWYRPVNRELFDENYKRVFGQCKSKNCPAATKCLRWLQTGCLFAGSIYEFDSNGTPCDYFTPCVTKNPDEEKLY